MYADLLEGPWWKTGALDKNVHYRLIARLDGISARAGLGPQYRRTIWEHLPPEVTPGEMQWLRGVIRKTAAGNLAYGGDATKAADRFRCFVGALLRNFVDARIMTVDMIADEALSGEEVQATALFVPDFAIAGETEKKSDAVKRAVVGVLRERLLDGGYTCLFADLGSGEEADLKAITRAYGAAIANEIATHFTPGIIE